MIICVVIKKDQGVKKMLQHAFTVYYNRMISVHYAAWRRWKGCREVASHTNILPPLLQRGGGYATTCTDKNEQ